MMYTHYLYRTITFFGIPFQVSLIYVSSQCLSPTTPKMPQHYRFGLFRVRSPLLAESLLFSTPMGTQMFQFPTFASLARCQVFNLTGCPIRISTDLFIFANPRSFSQLITSFFASESHRHPPYALIPMYSALIPVSYTHLTLPTICSVQISVVAVSLKKKKKKKEKRRRNVKQDNNKENVHEPMLMDSRLNQIQVRVV
eukprot:TRINITY_DN514_c0_g1_i4.p2 TRINITY_DN514_c0_g1~~TRINITY_DN514_c0_g1_i4.p2  ORF type:complete len:198 (-),score=-16.86 TRINITY_DN514_c0_g1_i4:24-617(-)